MIQMRQLSGPELAELRAAFKKAFRTDELRLQILQDRLDRDLEDYAPAGAVKDVIFDGVLDTANRWQWLAELVSAALAASPNETLHTAAQKLGFSIATPHGENLEKIVEQTSSFLNVDVWIQKIAVLQYQICRIVLDEGATAVPRGTGFLIGPSTVITNHHVVENAIKGSIDPKRLRAQFDYRVLIDGSVSAGRFVKLAPGGEWIIDRSPLSAVDLRPHPIETDVAEEELDYAILRLSEPVGSRPAGPAKAEAGATARPRGWIDLTAPAPKAAPRSSVLIVQHPNGEPMKLAIGTNSVVGYSPSERRIRYLTNTLPGSSGSAVFDENWRILALHHSGDPSSPTNNDEYNEGIPIPAIVALLRKRGLMEKIGS